MNQSQKQQDNKFQLPALKLPFWMDGESLNTEKKDQQQEPVMLTNGISRFWGSIRKVMLWPLMQLDAENCAIALVDLLAWERSIVRFNNEPEWLYRKRVKFATINAFDAGSTAGFIRIMQRLGLRVFNIRERQPDQDWDRVSIEIDDSKTAPNSILLGELIRQYGRTCRRYDFASSRIVANRIACVEIAHDEVTFTVRGNQ
ncbi:MAG: phage tail protein [Parashewanella sp.]